MSLRDVERIASTLLYEGYMLYPYRPTAVKNRQRFNFGVLYPSSYARERLGDASMMQTECLVRGHESTRIQVRVRFLRLSSRIVSRVAPPSATAVDVSDSNVRQVESLNIDGQVLQTWQDAAESGAAVAERLGDLLGGGVHHPFSFSGSHKVEQVRDSSGMVAAIIVRQSLPMQGELLISARSVGRDLYALRVIVENQTSIERAARETRERVLLSAFVSAHAILTSPNGEFISLADPPEDAREAARDCTNIGVWPVLVGEDGSKDTLLVSPIIVSDYPTLAPESPGDFFDATEMDEMLTLRILTLTDDEKREMANADERSRALLERTQSLAADQMMKLHGVMRATPIEYGGQ